MTFMSRHIVVAPIPAAPLLTGFAGQQWGQVLVRTSRLLTSCRYCTRLCTSRLCPPCSQRSSRRAQRLHRWSSTSLSPCRYRSICACDGVRWTPAPANVYIAPAPFDEYIAASPVVMRGNGSGWARWIAPAPAAIVASAPVVVYVALAPAVPYVAPAPVVCAAIASAP